MERSVKTIFAFTGLGTLIIFSTLSTALAAKTTLRVATWDTGEGLKTIQTACKEFTRKNPDIDVKVETWGGYQDKLLVSLGAGTAPDVFMLGEIDVGTFAYTGFIQPLDRYIKQDKMDISGLRKVLMKMYVAKGELIGLPKDYAPFAVYYNKPLLDAAGLPYPKEGWTWNECVLMAKKLTKFDAKGKITQNGFNFSPGNAETHVFLSSFKAGLMAPEKEVFSGWLDSKATLNAIQYMTDLRNKEHLLQSGVDFAGNKAALSLQGPWSMADYAKKKNFNYGIAPPPVGSQQGGCILSSAWCMSTATKYKTQSWKLVKFLGGPEGNKIMGQNLWAVPSWNQTVKELGIDKDPKLSQLMIASEDAVTIAPITHPFYNRVVAKYIYPLISGDLWNNKKTAASSLPGLVATCDKEYSRILKTQPKIKRAGK